MTTSNALLALGGSGDDGGSGRGGGQRPEMLRKTFWMESEMDEQLRREAFDTGLSEAEIVRSLLRKHYGLWRGLDRMDEDVEALLELWELGDPDPVDAFEDQLAAELGLSRGPGLSKQEWRRLRVAFIEVADRAAAIPPEG